MTLNPKRSANPFTPTEEPDWVAVPRSNSRLSSFSSLSSSPYEHVSHSMQLSSNASAVPPRKLPPPFESSKLPSQMGRMQLVEEKAASKQRSEVAPPPPPRRATGAQMSTFPVLTPSATSTNTPTAVPASHTGSSVTTVGGSKTKPPPVARKPAHLSTTSPSTSPKLPEATVAGSADRTGGSLRPSSAKISDLTTKLQSSGQGQLTGGMQRTTSFPVRTTGPGTGGYQPGPTSPPGGVSLPGLGQVERKAVPPRRAETVGGPGMQPGKQPRSSAAPNNAQRAGAPVDLLGGDDGRDMNSWETLRPT